MSSKLTPKLILNEALPEDLRSALDQVARAEDITVNDVASRVLAKHFKVEWSPSGFTYRPVTLGPLPQRFKLRVSEELHKELRIQAAQQLYTIRGLVLNTLSKHFRTDIVSPERRSRRKVA